MSDCCLPNLGCLSIPVVSTNVAGNPGQNGAAGNGIASESYDPLTGELTLTFTDSTTYTTGDLRGAPGGTGGQGANGVSRLYSNLSNNTSPTPTTLTTFVVMDTYTLPANTLVNNGDSIVVTINAINTNKGYDSKRRVMFNGVSCTVGTGGVGDEPFMYFPDSVIQYKTIVEIIKKSSTEALCVCYADLTIPGFDNNVPYFKFQNTLTVANFTTAYPITTWISQPSANEIIFKSVTIDKITAV